MKNPYSSAPQTSFWSKAVAGGITAADLVPSPLITAGDRVMTAGSCFASNIVPYLERTGVNVVRTEKRPVSFDAEPEAFSYDKFSASYGNVYTARQFLQLLKRALGMFVPVDSMWVEGRFFIDPFRPGLKYKARSSREFDVLTAQHLANVIRAVESATVFIFTLGLTEAWSNVQDGAVYPACPGTVAGLFDPAQHQFQNFNVQEVSADLAAIVDLMKSIQPTLRFIFTVSPVPLVATASGEHVLTASIYSKSVLRVAANEIVNLRPDCRYFPSYELATGPQAPAEYFLSDRRTVSNEAIDAIMSVFLSNLIPIDCALDQPKPIDSGRSLSRAIANAECEEAMAEINR